MNLPRFLNRYTSYDSRRFLPMLLPLYFLYSLAMLIEGLRGVLTLGLFQRNILTWTMIVMITKYKCKH